jgi:tRNA A37 threonylcarbamoyladenosine dehydratase
MKGLETFARSHVAVIGLGGVGSWAVEALARSGVGELTLVDLDEICVTNSNRQIHALHPNVGRLKSQVLADRCREINPEIKVNALDEFLTDANVHKIITTDLSYVIDAIDSIKNKALLAAFCREKNVPLIVSGGAGGRRDPTQIKIDDLSKTTNDPLLRNLRRSLRQQYNFPKSKKMAMECVYSTEQPVYPTREGDICFSKADLARVTDTGLKLDCRSGFGAASFVTGSFGFVIVARVLEKLCQSQVDEAQGGDQ